MSYSKSAANSGRSLRKLFLLAFFLFPCVCVPVLPHHVSSNTTRTRNFGEPLHETASCFINRPSNKVVVLIKSHRFAICEYCHCFSGIDWGGSPVCVHGGRGLSLDITARLRGRTTGNGQSREGTTTRIGILAKQ